MYMNVLLGGNYFFYKLSDKTAVIGTWTVSESIAVNNDSDNAIAGHLSQP